MFTTIQTSGCEFVVAASAGRGVAGTIFFAHASELRTETIIAATASHANARTPMLHTLSYKIAHLSIWLRLTQNGRKVKYNVQAFLPVGWHGSTRDP
jgi:hypothetical protein